MLRIAFLPRPPAYSYLPSPAPESKTHSCCVTYMFPQGCDLHASSFWHCIARKTLRSSPALMGKAWTWRGLVLKRLLLREMLPSHSYTPSSVPSHHLTRGPWRRRKSSCRAWTRSCCLFSTCPSLDLQHIQLEVKAK